MSWRTAKSIDGRTLIIDGTDEHGHLSGDAKRGPFALFCVELQDHVAGPYRTWLGAWWALRHVAKRGVPERQGPTCHVYEELVAASRLVLQRWEEGDLAEAVRELDATLSELDEMSMRGISTPIVRLGDPPLSHETLRELEARGDITVIVELKVAEMLQSSFEDLREVLSRRVTGPDCALVGMTHSVCRLADPEPDAVAFRVTAAAVDWVNDDEDETA